MRIRRTEYQPRFVAYAKAQGLTCGEVLARDRKAGAVMMPFMLWIQCAWAEWRRQFNIAKDAILSNEHHREFDIWLISVYVN